jgi:nicotinate-nucleotide pyrophosphorylase (carboxylating)
MSAIATKTNSFVKLLEGTNTKMIPRKTTPGFRVAEKWAVKWVGRESPFALYDYA